MRIIGGQWRGRRVRFGAQSEVRPTPNRIRETLFNWLRESIVDARCLDLFAGSGALGLEALSRGAKECVFVESSAQSARCIREHLIAFGARGDVAAVDAMRFLQRNTDSVKPFDIVFLDPPHGRSWLNPIVAALAAGHWVAAGASVYLECERHLPLPPLPSTWEILKSKSAGEVSYHLARVSVPAHDHEK